MVILGLETVTRRGSVALWDHGTCHAREGESERMHGERLPHELLGWLAAHGRTVADVTHLAVVSGPGSFTGLRVGLAVMQGIAVASGLSIVEVPTLDALASCWTFHHPGSDAVVAPCLDGQRGEVFIAAFRAQPSPNGESRADTDSRDAAGLIVDDTRQIVSPAAARPDEAAAMVGRAAAGASIVFVGDGASRYGSQLQQGLSGARVHLAEMTMAEAAVRIAAARPDTAVPPGAVRPVYLRRPDAEVARDKRQSSRPDAPDGHVIRRATGGDDLSAVEDLQRQTFTNPWDAASMRWELEHTDVARLYLMHDPSSRLVAYCACWIIFDELHINSLAVEPDVRRQGLARRLLQRVFHEAHAAGARAATLEVRSSNRAARALYEGLGFQVEGVRHDYYQTPREDALILWNRHIDG